MLRMLTLFVGLMSYASWIRRNPLLDNVALCHQVSVVKTKGTQPKLSACDLCSSQCILAIFAYFQLLPSIHR